MAIFLEYYPGNVEVIDLAKELAKNRVAYDGEERGAAETLTMEQLPALPPQVWQLLSVRLIWLVAKFVEVSSIPKAKLLTRARWPTRVSKAKVWAPQEVWGNLVAHL